MKIKITEIQAKRLKLINENVDPLTQFEHLCKVKVQEINKLYTNVINLSLIAILNKEIDMAVVYRIIGKIESIIDMGESKALAYAKEIQEDSLVARIDSAYDRVRDKLTPLQIIVMDLEKLQNSTEEHELTRAFNDIKPMDISGLQ